MALILDAKSVSFNVHPMDGFDRDSIKREFNIPNHYWLPQFLSVGYFKEGNNFTPLKWRKTYDEILLFNFNGSSFMVEKDIKVYSLSTCGHCKSIKKLLNEFNDDYDFIDVDFHEKMKEKSFLKI